MSPKGWHRVAADTLEISLATPTLISKRHRILRLCNLCRFNELYLAHADFKLDLDCLKFISLLRFKITCHILQDNPNKFFSKFYNRLRNKMFSMPNSTMMTITVDLWLEKMIMFCLHCQSEQKIYIASHKQEHSAVTKWGKRIFSCRLAHFVYVSPLPLIYL